MDLWDPGIISIPTLLCKRCNPSLTLEKANKNMDNDASCKLHHSNVLLTEHCPCLMFAWRECGDDWRDEPSTAEPAQPPSLGLRCLRGPVQCSVYNSTTTTLHQWPSGVTVRCPMIGSHVTRSLCPPPHHCCHPSHKGEKWTVLRCNVETLLGLSHFSIF